MREKERERDMRERESKCNRERRGKVTTEKK